MVIDDHPLFRQGLCGLIGKEADLEVTAEVGNGGDAISAAHKARIDIAIVDMLLPVTSGSHITRELKVTQPGCKILGLSMVDEPTRIAEMMRAGADGFALKSQGPAEIVNAIRAVLAGERYLPPEVPRLHIETLVQEDGWILDRLTARESEIFELLVKGLTNDTIAARLHIAKRTVETHRQHILKKLGAKSLVDLIRIGIQYGLPTT